ncbi:MAG: ThuA domain-containing protein [Bryobacterales bacterium]|nr:ThuA domain-containing protein [Bryobacterales bacterium]
MRALTLLLLGSSAWAAEPVRVQVTTGGHPYDISFYSIFEGQPDLAVTLNPHPSAYRRDLRRFADVLVLYDLHDLQADSDRQTLRNFVESGKGVVVLHHALADNWQWKWWYEDVVGGRFLMGDEGAAKRSAAKNGAVIVARPVAEHPVLAGVGTLKLDDETYKGMWLSPAAKVLMETDHPENDRAIVWIGPSRQSRVVAIQLGHGAAAHRDAGYRRLVRNAILWAAGRDGK